MTDKETNRRSPRRRATSSPSKEGARKAQKARVTSSATKDRKTTKASPRGRGKASSASKAGGRGRGGQRSFPSAQRDVASPKSSKHIPPPEKDTVRVILLGGVEEVGRNMLAIELNDDIVVIDCGIQFKEQETPGIDYILPNTKYLEERKDKVRAVFITHGHLDHIGAIPYIVPKIGNPPIYTRNLTSLMIKKRQEEFPHLPPLELHVVETTERVMAGDIGVRFFAVTHTIPDSMGIMVETPYGNIIHTGDLKLDHTDGVPAEYEQEEFGRLGKENNLLLMADSTNVERPGFSIPESKVFENIEKIIVGAKSRLIIGTFASQIERIAKIISIAEENNKKVVIDGRSMKTNVEIARLAGSLKAKKGTLITPDEMGDYPPEKIVALVTGAQGDEFAVLMRVANKNHKTIKINKNDTIVLSSSIVPGNERGVQKLKDNLSRQGADIVHYQVSDVHSSGHANRDETKWIHDQIDAKFFIPLHGYHYMLRVHGQIARERGVPEENITIPDNSMIVEIKEGKKMSVHKESAPRDLILVDGFSIGEIQEVVLRDRQMLAQDGMFVIVVTVDPNTGKVRKSPDLISRGFVYLRESQDLLKNARTLVKKNIEKSAGQSKPINFDYLKKNLTDELSKYLFKKTNKRPIVIPVILGL